MTYLAQINETYNRLHRKSLIVKHLIDKESIHVEIGEEWSDPSFIDGVKVKNITSYYDNEKSTIMSSDGFAGTVMQPHYHTSEELFICAKGSVRFNIGGKELILNTLNTLRIPAHTTHSFEFLEDSLIFMIWTPKFQDQDETKIN